ncbi:hypothetical protein ACJ41O_002060 [Fusarium nematophilum]
MGIWLPLRENCEWDSVFDMHKCFDEDYNNFFLAMIRLVVNLAYWIYQKAPSLVKFLAFLHLIRLGSELPSELIMLQGILAGVLVLFPAESEDGWFVGRGRFVRDNYWHVLLLLLGPAVIVAILHASRIARKASVLVRDYVYDNLDVEISFPETQAGMPGETPLDTPGEAIMRRLFVEEKELQRRKEDEQLQREHDRRHPGDEEGRRMVRSQQELLRQRREEEDRRASRPGHRAAREPAEQSGDPDGSAFYQYLQRQRRAKMGSLHRSRSDDAEWVRTTIREPGRKGPKVIRWHNRATQTEPVDGGVGPEMLNKVRKTVPPAGHSQGTQTSPLLLTLFGHEQQTSDNGLVQVVPSPPLVKKQPVTQEAEADDEKPNKTSPRQRTKALETVQKRYNIPKPASSVNPAPKTQIETPQVKKDGNISKSTLPEQNPEPSKVETPKANRERRLNLPKPSPLRNVVTAADLTTLEGSVKESHITTETATAGTPPSTAPVKNEPVSTEAKKPSTELIISSPPPEQTPAHAALSTAPETKEKAKEPPFKRIDDTISESHDQPAVSTPVDEPPIPPRRSRWPRGAGVQKMRPLQALRTNPDLLSRNNLQPLINRDSESRTETPQKAQEPELAPAQHQPQNEEPQGENACTVPEQQDQQPQVLEEESFAPELMDIEDEATAQVGGFESAPENFGSFEDFTDHHNVSLPAWDEDDFSTSHTEPQGEASTEPEQPNDHEDMDIDDEDPLDLLEDTMGDRSKHGDEVASEIASRMEELSSSMRSVQLDDTQQNLDDGQGMDWQEEQVVVAPESREVNMGDDGVQESQQPTPSTSAILQQAPVIRPPEQHDVGLTERLRRAMAQQEEQNASASTEGTSEVAVPVPVAMPQLPDPVQDNQEETGMEVEPGASLAETPTLNLPYFSFIIPPPSQPSGQAPALTPPLFWSTPSGQSTVDEEDEFSDLERDMTAAFEDMSFEDDSDANTFVPDTEFQHPPTSHHHSASTPSGDDDQTTPIGPALLPSAQAATADTPTLPAPYMPMSVAAQAPEESQEASQETMSRRRILKPKTRKTNTPTTPSAELEKQLTQTESQGSGQQPASGEEEQREDPVQGDTEAQNILHLAEIVGIPHAGASQVRETAATNTPASGEQSTTGQGEVLPEEKAEPETSAPEYQTNEMIPSGDNQDPSSSSGPTEPPKTPQVQGTAQPPRDRERESIRALRQTFPSSAYVSTVQMGGLIFPGGNQITASPTEITAEPRTPGAERVPTPSDEGSEKPKPLEDPEKLRRQILARRKKKPQLFHTTKRETPPSPTVRGNDPPEKPKTPLKPGDESPRLMYSPGWNTEGGGLKIISPSSVPDHVREQENKDKP